MTADEFERKYAARSGMTVEKLHSWGLHAEPCPDGEHCIYADCTGWIMGRPWEIAIVEDEIRGQAQK